MIRYLKKINALFNRIRTRREISVYIKKEKTINIEFGEPKKRLEGWLNIDFSQRAELRLDLTKNFPIPDNCVKKIYSSHLLEHFSREELKVFLSECKRILVDKGSFLVAVPDAEQAIRAYVDDDNSAYMDSITRTGFEYYTKLDVLNFVAYYGEHKNMFDRIQLLEILRSSGFKDAAIREYDDFLDLEDRRKYSIYAEAKK